MNIFLRFKDNQVSWALGKVFGDFLQGKTTTSL